VGRDQAYLRLRLFGLPILAPVFEHLFRLITPVVLAAILAGILPVGLAVLFLGCADLLSVRRIVFSLLIQDLFSVLEVTETTNFGRTGFAAPTEAIPGSMSAMILSQGLALLAIGAGLRLQDSLGGS
jgi:hypothetical protein